MRYTPVMVGRSAVTARDPGRVACNLDLERKWWHRGLQRVAGVDEVGRGPLAGPVLAAAVVLPSTCKLPGVTDSKLLTDARRRELVPVILQQCLAVGIGIVDPEEIDRTNILRASFEAMRRALRLCEPDAAIVDGRHAIPGATLPQQAVVKGDQRSASVAAASIIAKVWRDDIMATLDIQYPGYGFAGHKGYATASHFEALDRLGPCPIHRQTFLRRWRERSAQTLMEWRA